VPLDGDVWLAYGRRAQPDGSERWTVGIPAQEPDVGGPPAGRATGPLIPDVPPTPGVPTKPARRRRAHRR
jgi:hypothetical protein